MTMSNITLYKFKGDDREVYKTPKLTKLADRNIRPTGSLNIYTPYFVIDYDKNLLGCNYIYFEETNRYYFVTDCHVDIGKTIGFSCSIDVLYTYQSVIRNLKATILRTARQNIGYVPDDKLPIDQNQYTIYGKNLTDLPEWQYSGGYPKNIVLGVVNSDSFN